MAFIRLLRWALILLLRIRFRPSESLAEVDSLFKHVVSNPINLLKLKTKGSDKTHKNHL